MSIQSAINTILEADPSVVGAVDSYTSTSGTEYMIFASIGLPTTVKTATGTQKLSTENKTINHYYISPIPGSNEAVQINYVVDCRADTEVESKAIRDAVFNTLNRQRDDNNCYFFVCAKSEPIPPKDADDNYNAVVNISAHGLLNNE